MNVLIVGSNALTGVLVARSLGAAGRGQVAVVLIAAGLIHMLGSTGMQSSVTYHVAAWPDRRVVVARWFRRVAVSQAVAMTVVSAGVACVLRWRLGLNVWLLAAGCVWPPGATLSLYGTCLAQGCGDFRRFNLIRAAPGVVTAIAVLGFAASGSLTLVTTGAAYVLPLAVGGAIGLSWMWRVSGESGHALRDWERRSLLSYARRSLASLSGMALNRASDQAALGLVAPLASLGIYSVAASATSPLAMVVSSLGMVGLPSVAAAGADGRGAAAKATLRRTVIILALAAPAMALILPWGIPFVYGRRYSRAVGPAELMLFGAVFAALASVVDDLLRGYGRPGFVSVSQGIGGLLTVVGTVLVSGRPLSAVAAISAGGFFVAFVLGYARLLTSSKSHAGAGRAHANYAHDRSGRGRHRKARSAPGLNRPGDVTDGI